MINSMEAVPLYRMNRMPSSSAVDIAKSMKLSYVFDCFQDIAGLHAENLGAGIDHIKAEFGVAWILMRMRIEIERYAHLEEPLVVETWPQPPKTLYDRDYIIRAEGSGEILARSVSTWVLMDLAAHDIAKGRVFDYTYPIENTERAIDCKLRQLKAPDAPVKVADHAVRYSDIDYNLHVNNARYIDLIMDTYSLEFHQAHEVAAIEVNYINEIRPDETLVIAKAAYPDSDLKEYIELSSATDGRVAIKAAIKFRKRK